MASSYSYYNADMLKQYILHSQDDAWIFYAWLFTSIFSEWQV